MERFKKLFKYTLFFMSILLSIVTSIKLYDTKNRLIEIQDRANLLITSYESTVADIEKTMRLYKAENESLRYQNEILIDEVNLLNDYKKNVEMEIAEAETFVDTKNGIVNVDNYSQLDLTSKANLSVDEINYVLKDTPMSGLGTAFVNAESEYGVNSAFLLSLAILESGWGTSNIAQNKYNLFGFTAYDDSPSMSATSFSSYEDSIRSTAKHLKESYLSEGGQYFKGYKIQDVNYYYCTTKTWTNKIYDVLHTISKRVKLHRGD